MIEKGLVLSPPETFQVICDGKNVDNVDLYSLDGKYLCVIEAGSIPPHPVPPAPRPSGGYPRTLILASADGKTIKLNIKMIFSQHTIANLTKEAKYFDKTRQFALYPINDGNWMIEPNPYALNKTMLNGKECNGNVILKLGDIISVGNPKTGITRAALNVSFVEKNSG